MTQQVNGLARGTRSWNLQFVLDGVAVDPTTITITLARIDNHGKPVVVETQNKADLTSLGGTGAYRYTTVPGNSGKFEARITTGGDANIVDTKIPFEVPTTFAGAQ